jgi:hypothetical protein
VFFLDTASSPRELAVWESGKGIVNIGPTGPLGNAAITPDGSTLVFTSWIEVPGFNSGGFAQVYRYETASRQLQCVSCAPSNVTPIANARLSAERTSDEGGATWDGGELKAPHFFAEGGRRIFFETAQPLVVTDINSAKDVYEWEDGQVHLISGGQNLHGSFLIDSSASGDDVFFGTNEGLDPRDRDGTTDVYDARVGALPPAPLPVGCGSSCQGESGAPPAAPRLASTTGSGKGGASGKHEGSKLSVRTTGTKGATFKLAIKVPGAGRIVASGPGVQRAEKEGLQSRRLWAQPRARLQSEEKARQPGSPQREGEGRLHPGEWQAQYDQRADCAGGIGEHDEKSDRGQAQRRRDGD